MRVGQYVAYHEKSERIGDVDPSYEMLLYLVKRFELGLEQRYWLAWLYAMTYCGASAFYVYNEFPDYDMVDVGRLSRWWRDRGRDEILVQTDRRWVRSSDMFVPAFESYRSLVGSSQSEFFARFSREHRAEDRYERTYEATSSLHSFGQFALFLYLEALHTVTDLDLCPTDLDLNRAWSCRNGLYYAYGLDHLVRDTETPMVRDAVEVTERCWRQLRATLDESLHEVPTVWEIETVLCAFRKYMRGKRYVGYYLDRQASEIARMQSRARGVCWDVLWQYRHETYRELDLAERYHCVDEKGSVAREWVKMKRDETDRLVGKVRS